MKLIRVLSIGLLALVSMQPAADAQSSCGTRTRRDWEAMSSTDKDTYKRALEAAMDSGEYIKFVEMHTEMMSEREAHGQCMFIYWHRLLLVAFENMLRGQGAEFACVTVPYFNWVGANNRVLAGECSTFGNCADITAELGGWTSGSRQTLSINGKRASGTCVTESPLGHFCESSSVSGSSCAHCVPRGDWGSASVPTSTSYGSVREQVFSGQTIGEMSPLVERGCHNNVHANLGGTMGTFASPAEPLFWSHHAMVDALHTIFHKCRVGTDRLTFEEKASHPVAWTSCNRRDGGTFSPSDDITMRTGENGVNPIDGRSDPLIGQYFSGVPTQFAGLMDVRDLGESSYSYEFSGQLASMYSDCDGTSTPAPTTAAPQPTTSVPVATTAAPVVTTATPVATTSAPVATTAAPVPVTAAPVPTAAPTPAPQPNWGHGGWGHGGWGHGGWGHGGWGRGRWGRFISHLFGGRSLETEGVVEEQRNLKAEHGHWGNRHYRHGHGYSDDDCDSDESEATQNGGYTNAPVTATPETQAPSSYDTNNNNVDVIIVPDSYDTASQLVTTWYEVTMTTMGGHCADNRADLERQLCMFENQCLGGTFDYSDEFKAIWGNVEPRCLTIVNAINSGEQTIAFAAWRENMETHFGCPTPANTTSVEQQDSAYSSGVVSAVTSTFNDAVQSV